MNSNWSATVDWMAQLSACCWTKMVQAVANCWRQRGRFALCDLVGSNQL